jgi:phosphonate transport system ATP-binding protein
MASARSWVTDAAFDLDGAAGGVEAAGRFALNDTLLRGDGVRKRYADGREVIAGVDLSLRAGERVALIGPNGSGKSTLLRCLMGLQPLSGGAVTLLGERFTAMPGRAQRRRLRLRLGFVFQFHGLVKRRTALSNVVHGLMAEGGGWRGFCHNLAPREARERAMAALEAVGLAEYATARADALSGGQQQRVAIARALVRRPALLVADEPAASLDPAAGHEVMALFTRLAEARGTTLLFTSHDMGHARAYADRIVALGGGRVLFDTAATDVDEAMLRGVFHG